MINLVQLITFLFLLVLATAAGNAGLGYLFLNGSRTPHCYDLVGNEICPPRLVDYQILGFDNGEELAQYELFSVKIQLQGLNFYHVSGNCRNSLRVYLCSNTLAVCRPDSKYGVDVRYNYEKTEAACAKVQAECPKNVADAFTFNCSMIQKNATGYSYCVHEPNVPGDKCAKSNYKYPAAIGKIYQKYANALIKYLPEWEKYKLFTSPSCESEFLEVYCQTMRGTICSTDQTLRMFAISQQDCAATYNKCLSSRIPEVKNYFVETCKYFPDATTAKRVPLPDVRDTTN